MLFERGDLLRVVGDEAHGVDAEQLQCASGNFEDAAVRLVAELKIGLDGVETLILQLVGTQLGHQPDAAAFLLFVDQDAGAFVDDALHCQFELLTAIAAKRAEDIAGEALRMNADDRGRGVDIAEHEGDAALYTARGRRIAGPAGLGFCDDAFETMNAEMSPAGREVCLSYLADRDGGHA